jgi:hypothetical protein
LEKGKGGERIAEKHTSRSIKCSQGARSSKDMETQKHMPGMEVGQFPELDPCFSIHHGFA